ncbi:DgyrCDS1847 [Dimorphilus gyrociliatus]|uniref:Hyaluronidase n=1 Tax=Dimorphilus gyrociliatus TaxID=2664684 RepID=A0A7I8V8L0_9ANNE|nr:DgyrCDS1847 [Dimorphilus gyrociliatus]
MLRLILCFLRKYFRFLWFVCIGFTHQIHYEKANSFSVIWNTPVQDCYNKYGLDLKSTLESFRITVNKFDGLKGDRICLFYRPDLGYYPYFDQNGKARNGGLPQMANLSKHLEKAERDIEKFLDKGFSGLAVIDWEDWRPLFKRNWDSKKIYQDRSIELVKRRYPTWPMDKIIEESRKEFEKSARQFMEATINLGKKLRPMAKWGFYLFPDCYHNKGDYKCSKTTKDDNDKLKWLFRLSTALFPSAYLKENLSPTSQWKFVRNRMTESIRVRKLTGQLQKPLYLYSKYYYSSTTSFYKVAISQPKVTIKEDSKEIKVWRSELAYNWPSYRRNLSKDDLWNENIEDNALKNILFKRYWPIVHNSTKYVLYECLKADLCGGWGNRLQGILVAYFLALISERQLLVNIAKPCNLTSYLKSNLIHWDTDIPNGERRDHNFLDSYPDNIEPFRFNELLTNLFDDSIQIVSFKTGQFGYLKYFSVQQQFRQLLLSHGFRDDDLTNFNYLQLPLKYNIYDLLFKPQPSMQRKKDEFFRKLNGNKLICAHLRTGDSKSLVNDFDYENLWAASAVWEFFEKKINSNVIYSNSKIFVATDSQYLRDEAKKLFKDRILDIEGAIVHLDLFYGEKNDICDATEKVILDWEILSECDVLVTLPWSTFSSTALNRNRHRNELYAWHYESEKRIAKVVPVKQAQKWLLGMVDTMIGKCKCLSKRDLSKC